MKTRHYITAIASLLMAHSAMASTVLDYTGFTITFNDASLLPQGQSVDSSPWTSPQGQQLQRSEVDNLQFNFGQSSQVGITGYDTYSFVVTAKAGYYIDNVDFYGVSHNAPALHQSAPQWNLNGDVAQGVSTQSGVHLLGNGDYMFGASLSNLPVCSGTGCLHSSSGINSLSFDATYAWTGGALPQAGFSTLDVRALAMPVPEPETYALMGMGVMGLALRRRKQQREA